MKIRILVSICALAVITAIFAAACLIHANSARKASVTGVSDGSSGDVSDMVSASGGSSGGSASGPESSESSGTPSASVSSGSTGYTVKIYGDGIGIFEDGKDTPEKAEDLSPDTLPKSERERLEVGIHVDNYDDALALLEDYTS